MSFLKTRRREIRRPLYVLWRASLDQGLIPEDLLLVLISPVHKGGSRGIPKNHRPIALTSHVVKVFERVVRRALIKHLSSPKWPAWVPGIPLYTHPASLLLGHHTRGV